MQISMEPLPAPMVVAIVATVVWGTAAVVLGLPFVRAWTRRMDKRDEKKIPADVSQRLERIEAAVESIAIEVERISESQRFLAKLQSERLPSGSTASDPRR